MLEQVKIRKRLEYEQKIRALETELDSWSSRSQPDAAFEKHHTQIRAVQAHLKGWHGSIRKKLADYEQNDADTYLSKCANAEKLILSEHRIWDYFRSKLIQRNEELFNPYLRAADEFAWSCYQPIQKIVHLDPADSKRKEPPLVFFNGGASPFSVSRERSFQAELVAGENIPFNSQADLMKLPIPVVGVPWDQISFLPEALVIGHEVGHLVEDDFLKDQDGESTRLKQLLAEALSARDALSRSEAWQSWLGEIFADLYGCLATGTAYAGALIDFLAKGSSQISNERKSPPDWKRYPTDFLRVRIVLKTLEVMREVMKFDSPVSAEKFADELNRYKNHWGLYASKMPAEFTDDIEVIVPRLLKGAHDNLKGASIIEAFCFSGKQSMKALELVEAISKYEPERIIDGKVIPPTKAQIKSTDIRELFAAARLAYERYPDEYTEKGYGTVILKHIEASVIKKGVRADEPQLSKPQLRKRMDSYEQAGAAMAENLEL